MKPKMNSTTNHDSMNNLGDVSINLIMGDFNAKIGSDNQGYETVMEMHGLGVMNDNGERFMNACAINNIVIGGRVFTHKRINKATWVSPDQFTENQRDHIGINKMFRRSRVKRGADVASDHHLVTARLKLKLRRNGVEHERRKARYNVDFLKDPVMRNARRLKGTKIYVNEHLTTKNATLAIQGYNNSRII